MEETGAVVPDDTQQEESDDGHQQIGQQISSCSSATSVHPNQWNFQQLCRPGRYMLRWGLRLDLQRVD
jgi:hypothetical protein